MFDDNVFFEPWIGDNYGKENSEFNAKILVLGDSHYCDSCKDCGDKEKKVGCINFTSRVVMDYLNPDFKATWKRTYSRFINSFYGQSTNYDERMRFFKSICFYNFLQVAAGDNPYEASGGGHNSARHVNALKSVLQELSPAIVIVWGSRTWNIIPNDLGYGKADIISESNFQIKNYQFRDNTITFIGVHHPCCSYDTELHYNLFKKLKISLSK